MKELIDAAKAVIKAWDSPSEPHIMSVDNLRAAVERAEKPAADLDKWWGTLKCPPFMQYRDAVFIWQAAQRAERERCREIIIAMGGADAPELLRQIDSGDD